MPFYAEHFSTVEVNNTFYQLPEAATLRQWRQMTPDSFTFDVATMRAAVQGLGAWNPKEIVVAVSTASPDTCEMFASEVQDVICFVTRQPFDGVWLMSLAPETPTGGKRAAAMKLR